MDYFHLALACLLFGSIAAEGKLYIKIFLLINIYFQKIFALIELVQNMCVYMGLYFVFGSRFDYVNFHQSCIRKLMFLCVYTALVYFSIWALCNNQCNKLIIGCSCCFHMNKYWVLTC